MHTGHDIQLTFRGPHTHNRFQHDGLCQDSTKLMGELDGVFCACIESGIEIRLAGSVVGQTSCTKRQ